MISDTDMWYNAKEIRISFFGLVAGLFLLSGMNPSFSQEELPEISDEDLDLLEEFLEQAEELFVEENYDEAIFYYDKVLGIDPTDFDALFGMAFTLDAIGKFGEAISYYDKILAIDPSDIHALNGRALTFESLMSVEVPLPEILVEDFDLIEEFLEKADEFLEEENYDEAILFYDKTLAIDSSDIDAINGKALALYNIENYQEAITYYEQILVIDSSDIDALNGKALALYNIENYEEAITYYDIVLEIDSTDDDALFGKALALEGLGREEEAIPLLEKGIELEPPQVEFRVPPEETITQDEMVESDQTLFVIVGVFIVILIIIILLDLTVRRRKTVRIFETSISENQTILSKPTSKSIPNQKIVDIIPDQKDEIINLEVNQAIRVLQDLAEMNMLDDPKTAKQFLLMKGFSVNAVKNAMISMGIDPSHDTDL